VVEVEAATAAKDAEIQALRAENERLKAEMARRDANERRNCINWGPCSRHDDRMDDFYIETTGDCVGSRVWLLALKDI